MLNRDEFTELAERATREGFRLAGKVLTKFAGLAFDALAALAPEPDGLDKTSARRTEDPWDDAFWKKEPSEDGTAAPPDDFWPTAQADPAEELAAEDSAPGRSAGEPMAAAKPATPAPKAATKKPRKKSVRKTSSAKKAAKSANTPNRWSDEETERLVEMWNARHSHAEISEAIGRPLGSVKSRLRTLHKAGRIEARRPGRRPKNARS
jgi:DNA-directed RNA polymerase specialized sigma24 family protein